MAYGDTLLTTIDNPYNPFTQFDEWFLFDVQKGYNTCSRIGREAKTSDLLSDKENEEEFERACNQIIQDDFMQKYIKLNRNKKFDLKAINKLSENVN